MATRKNNTLSTTPANPSTYTQATEQNTTPATPGTPAPATNDKTVEITRSKSGTPCLWENGGGYSNTGAAQIITDDLGNSVRAIFVRRRGDLCCGNHALIPVREGDHIVTADRHRGQVAIQVERIISIQEDTATLTPETAPICYDAIEAAVAKSRDYHCRSAYYIKNND